MKWFQYGPVDLSQDISGYRIDTRRIRKAYLPTPAQDPSQSIIRGASDLTGLNGVKGDIRDALEAGSSYPLLWAGADAEGTGPSSGSPRPGGTSPSPSTPTCPRAARSTIWPSTWSRRSRPSPSRPTSASTA